MIKQEELIINFHELLKLPAETEWVEFKEAKTTFNFEDNRHLSKRPNGFSTV